MEERLLEQCRKQVRWEPIRSSLRADPALVRTFEGNCFPVASVAVSGDYVVTGSDDDTAKVWSLTSGDLLATLEGHSDKVTGVAVSCDLLATGSEDKTIRLWDLRCGAQGVVIFRADHQMQNLAMTSGYVVATDAAGRLHILRDRELAVS